MHIQRRVSLKPFNTFGIDAFADHFMELTDESQLEEMAADTSLPQKRLVLGGGSNILFTRDVDALVIKNSLKGIEVAEENEQHIWLKVMAGEVWHDFVLYAINNNLGGIENLSLIPGCVGASPMQNIGAYGVEVKDTIDEVVAWHWEDKKWMVLKKEDCRFGYRESIFKHELKDKVLITSVTYKLDKIHCLNTSYGAIQQELEKMGVGNPSIKSVSDAVIAIRQSKLPDPARIGNAGSFFKNPTIPKEQYENIIQHYPAMPSYPVSDDTVKVPAGWLIEQTGWKGYKDGDAGVHTLQALVLVNYGNAKGAEIWELSGKILESVREKFGIELEREVNIW